MHFDIFPAQVYVNRRNVLKKKVGSGLVLLMGNEESPMNYKDNAYPFRQDSAFLYYFGLDVAGLAALIDVDNNDDVIFGNEQSIDDVVWNGSLPTIAEMAGQAGVTKTRPANDIADVIKRAQASGRKIHWLPPYRSDNRLKLSSWLSLSYEAVAQQTSVALIKAVVAMRSIKEDIEIAEMDHAARISEDMHNAVMRAARVGMKEYELAAVAEQVARAAGGRISYPVIMTTQGQILHTHYYGNVLKEGDMVLCDAGAENAKHYAGDLTRTFPVSKKFTGIQKELYQVVQTSHDAAVNLLKPGARFLDVHNHACLKLAEGLKQVGLMKGNPEEAVAAGAHTMFFQCGLGHMMGLDVHDMEDLGEEYVGYTDTLKKGTVFGLKSLRLGKALEPGYVVTVEPGIYIIPELIDLWKPEKKYAAFIDYAKLEKFRNFTGIRIENDFVITPQGFKRLGKALASTPDEIEELRA